MIKGVSLPLDSDQKDDDSGNKSEQTARIGLKRPREDDEFEDVDNGEAPVSYQLRAQ